jgi:hypothetical protein
MTDDFLKDAGRDPSDGATPSTKRPVRKPPRLSDRHIATEEKIGLDRHVPLPGPAEQPPPSVTPRGRSGTHAVT